MPASSSRDNLVRAEIDRVGRRQAFGGLIAANDTLILGAGLEIGREIAAARSAIYRGVMAHWAAEQLGASAYDRPFAVVALGGTGREEMTPCSDTDFAFLFDDVIENNRFLLELQRRVLHSDEFYQDCGFRAEVLPFNLDDMPGLEGKQLNAFLDMQPVFDPDGLAPLFRSRIQASYDPFEHFLHVSRFWRDNWGASIAESERLDRFDIKSDGLRVFLAGIWTMAGTQFCHSHEIYEKLHDPRDLDAFAFLLRIRAFVHLRRGTRQRPSATGGHPEDVLGFADFASFGDMLGPDSTERERFEFANEVRSRLLSARRRVDRFTWGAIGRALKDGRPISQDSTIVYGRGGLRDTAADRRNPWNRSRSALAMLLASQRYGLPIDPAEMEVSFRNAGDWLVPVPELSALFYEPRGSLADSLQFLSQLPGAEERLFPGYAKFECSLDERVMTEQKLLRGALALQKIRALEGEVSRGRQLLDAARDPDQLADRAAAVSIPIEAALLDANHLAAIKLALMTKRLPETPEDIAIRENEALPLYERYSSGLSGIPLTTYYTRSFADCEFNPETLETAKFLVENRRAFKRRAASDLMDAQQVEEILKQSDNSEARLRALFVFTYADRTDWESEAQEPERWFRIRELFSKARMRFQPDFDPTYQLTLAGYSPDQLRVLKDFGSDLFDGVYRDAAIRFGSYLLRLKEAAASDTPLPPRVERIRIGASEILAVASHDIPGMAASISGAFWKNGIGLRQAHLFSATNQRLALDFFHLAPPAANPATLPDPLLIGAIREAIVQQLYTREEDESALPAIAKNISLETSPSGLYCLRAETGGDVGALIYVLTCKAFRRLGANVYGLAAHTGKDSAWASIYLSLPTSLSHAEARAIVSRWE